MQDSRCSVLTDITDRQTDRDMTGADGRLEISAADIREIYMYSYPTGESLDGLITHSTCRPPLLI
jgi:hypothetical protein